MVDSSWMWIGLTVVFGIVLLYAGMYNSESAYLQRAEEYGDTLYEINQKGLMYEKQENHQEFEKYAKLLQQNLGKVSRDALKLDVTPWHDHRTYFPLKQVSDLKPYHDRDVELCNVDFAIPFHLHEISKTERFKIFHSKYSDFSITLDIMDERKALSALHYGLSVNSSNGKYASTYFHVNTCTDKITDEFRYVLNCRDETTDYFNSALSKDDFISSIIHDDFCIIPLDSWRQSLHDYGKKITQIRHGMMDELEDIDQNNESMMEFHAKMQQWDLLQEISNQYYQGDTEQAEKKILEYTLVFGTLPDDLLDIIDKKSVK